MPANAMSAAVPWPSIVSQCAAAPDESRTRFAFVCVAPRDGGPGERFVRVAQAGWLAVCCRVTPRVERVADGRALLELGPCTQEEALAVARRLVWGLANVGLRARVGMGSSMVLAQLVLLRAPGRATIALLPEGATPDLLRSTPVTLLPRLHPPCGAVPLLPLVMVGRLRRYGLRTLGHVARLGEAALRRQFGDKAGTWLAAVARGEDAALLAVTPASARQRLRVRFETPLSPERVLAALPVVAAKIAKRLQGRGRRARSLAVRVWWEAGGVQQARVHLRGHTAEAAALARELRRLLVPLLRTGVAALPAEGDADKVLDAGDGMDAGDAGGAIGGLLVTLGDCAPAVPAQAAFWQPRKRRWETLAGLGEALARRYPNPLSERRLLSVLRQATPAVFHEERFTLFLVATPATPTTPTTSPAALPPHERAARPWRRSISPFSPVSPFAPVGDLAGLVSIEGLEGMVPEPHWW